MQYPNHDWTIFSNHGLVLFHVAAMPDATQRELAYNLGLTERQVGRILGDLASVGFLQIQRQGRRNRYRVNPEAHLRQPLVSHVRLGRILAAVSPEPERQAGEAAEPSADDEPIQGG